MRSRDSISGRLISASPTSVRRYASRLRYEPFIGSTTACTPCGATVVMDLWLLLLRRGLGVPTLDYAMLGRWLGHIPRGTYVHVNIAKAEPLPVERVLGWFAHYAIGITFAAVLLAIWGLDWARSPTLLPALLIGLATVAAPFLVLQPALGAGIASSKAKNPTAVRLRSVLTHTVYGLGLYASARFWAALVP